VFCHQGELHLVTALGHIPHLTGVVSISGGGAVLSPILFLKNLQHFRELTTYESHCRFPILANGWITKDLWVYFTLVFCAQISLYPLTLPVDFREQDMFLIIDGHKTRLSLLAAVIFELNGIDVLVLPAHSTHLLQLFDVAVASPIKAAFKQELDKRAGMVIAAGPDDKTQMLRIALVESFTNGLQRGATSNNILAGFRASGVYPYNPSVPLSSDFVVEPPNDGMF
jgi:hypothetical protein